MKERKLTIFTPIYNRAYCLNNCYQSMRRQKNKRFIWIIVDDGSTDNLESLVSEWIVNESEFQIEKKMEVCTRHTIWHLNIL